MMDLSVRGSLILNEDLAEGKSVYAPSLIWLVFPCFKPLSFCRFLQHLGYEVTYIRNFTDVDDKV